MFSKFYGDVIDTMEQVFVVFFYFKKSSARNFYIFPSLPANKLHLTIQLPLNVSSLFLNTVFLI